MLTIGERPLTTEEKARLGTSTEKFFPGYMGVIAYYGAFLILIPAVGGGLIGTVLTFLGAPENIAYTIGLVAAGAYGVARLLKAKRGERRAEREVADRRERDLARGVAEVLDLKGITRAWEIDFFEPDFGPGYLLQADPEQFVYLATQALLDYEEGQFPTVDTIIERLPVTKTVLRVTATDAYLAPHPEPITDRELALDPQCGDCEIFSRAALPEGVRRKLQG